MKEPEKAATPLRAIVFDLDGTLYENRPFGRTILACAVRIVAALRGIDSAATDALIRETKREIAAETGYEASLTEACRRLGIDARELHRRFSEELEPEAFLSADPRVEGLLERLSSRFTLYLYTNNNRYLTERILERIGCSRFFLRPFTIEESWEPKPHPPTLEAILREIGREPAECLFVGDRYDIDLRLPATMGCPVFLSRTVDDLLTLNALLPKE